jgi:ferredoxin
VDENPNARERKSNERHCLQKSETIDGVSEMEMESVKLVYFSPTGTTKAVVQGIARGIHPGNVESVDITRPDARIQPLRTSEKELLIIGVPVYMGRVPALLTDWLRAISAQNTPAVCVVVYGNRAYEDALIELNDILTQCGCRPIAGAAYLGEHSFSDDETPTAKDRPDARDVHHAESFGRKVREKLTAIPSVDRISGVTIPGCHPYRGDSTLWTVDFIAVGDACTQCGICAAECPVGAIDPDDSAVIDTEKCITCCACIKHCPEHARSMKPGLVKDAQLRLHTLYSERKEPECFL